MTYTKEILKERITKSQTWLERAILALESKQTPDEQAEARTKYYNCKGFYPREAKRGEYYARWIKSGKHLSGVHKVVAMDIALTHVNQLVKIANRVI